jgi:hypothetical protein
MLDQIGAWLIIAIIAAHFTPVMWFAKLIMLGQREQARKSIAKADRAVQYRNGQPVRRFSRNIVKY